MFKIIDNRNTSHLIRKAVCFLVFGQVLLFTLPSALPMAAAQNARKALTKEEHKKFELVEATIEDIHNAIKTNEITCTELVQQYIDRAKAYNGVCTHH